MTEDLRPLAAALRLMAVNAVVRHRTSEDAVVLLLIAVIANVVAHLTAAVALLHTKGADTLALVRRTGIDNRIVHDERSSCTSPSQLRMCNSTVVSCSFAFARRRVFPVEAVKQQQLQG
jgi:hypothetical protein